MHPVRAFPPPVEMHIPNDIPCTASRACVDVNTGGDWACTSRVDVLTEDGMHVRMCMFRR